MYVFVVYHVLVLQSTTSAPLILSAYVSLCFCLHLSVYLSVHLSSGHRLYCLTSNIIPPSPSVEITVLHKNTLTDQNNMCIGLVLYHHISNVYTYTVPLKDNWIAFIGTHIQHLSKYLIQGMG